MNIKEALSFDDVLIVPQYSDILSREDVDLTSVLDEKRNIVLKYPFISSCMNTITEDKMAIAMAKFGGLGIVHRYNTTKEQCKIIERVKNKGNYLVAAAVGVSGDYFERTDALIKEGVDIICIDVAHGHTSLMEKALKSIKDKFNIHVMAGNIATAEGYQFLEVCGANSVRISIGSGGICSTRINTGCGVPLLQSILDCVPYVKNVPLIADGGLKNNGDIVKALAAGCDFIMGGGPFCGTDECPGDIIEQEGKKYKVYSGMASKESTEKVGKKYSVEGISTLVSYRGTVVDLLENIKENVKAGLSYSGARNIKELQTKVKFVRQTALGRLESDTHVLYRK